MDLRIASYTLSSSAGLGLNALSEAIETRQSGLTRNNYQDSTLNTWIGRVHALDSHQLPESISALNSRNNRLADLALQQDNFTQAVLAAKEQFPAHRIGVIIGTSTSSVGKTEWGYRSLDENDHMPSQFEQPALHNPHAPGHFVAKRLGITGPSMTVSTACSSSSKVFAAGRRWLQCGLVDAVLVGGVDSLCLSILHGFASLELISPEQCKPFDQNRTGINIGEAAGFALLIPAEQHSALEQITAAGNNPKYAVQLAGVGESSDAYHMAHPHPEGKGASTAMRNALVDANLSPEQIAYANLHGTATRANDMTEARSLSALFGKQLKASSSKGWMGHTLGAAGIAGSVIAMEAMQTGLIPGTLNLDTIDNDLSFPIQQENVQQEVNHVLANSFGFGGNNCSLIFSKVVH